MFHFIGIQIKMNNKTLVISKPRSIVKDGWYRLAATIDVENGEPLPDIQKEIWFALPEEYAEEYVFPDCSDCFLLGLLYFAMRFGYDICIKGEVSEKFLNNLKNEAMPLISAYYKYLNPVDIIVTNTTDFPEGKYVGTGFSAGVDSFYTIFSNLNENKKDNLTHLFFFNVGTHGLGRSFKELEHVHEKFIKRYNSFLVSAKMIELPFIPIDSNVHSFLPDNISAAITTSNSSVIHFLRKGIGQYFLSSGGYNYEELFKHLKNVQFEKNLEMDDIELMLCQWLGDKTLNIVPYGASATRLMKTQFIMNYPAAQQCLNVCNSIKTMEKNCSVCIKCRRTMMDLELLGKLDDFRSVFDVDLYRRKFKSRDYAEMMYPSPGYEYPFLDDARHYAIEHKIDIKSQIKTMDLVCAYLHQTWLYILLKKMNVLRIVKRLFGRN